MLGVFKNLFDNSREDALSGDQMAERLRMATCVILLEAATADDHFTDEEQGQIINILQDRFQMTPEAVRELVESAEKERKSATDLWYYTNVINENMDNEEKYRLMELVWEVIYSDGTLDKFENYVAHKLLNMLRLDHSRFIDIKMKVKNELSRP